MKSRIFLYLFVFSALVALYLGISGNRTVKTLEKQIIATEGKLSKLEDSLQQSQLQVLDMQYFSLKNNDDALAYYDHLGIQDPARYIADKLLETNEQEGDNPLVPYEGMQNSFKINKIKLLNHKWIIADFSDGKYWGELLINYELKDDLSVDFTLTDHLLYTRN
ncbi:hydrolase [Lentiprolixibacter aurantiacus]|uniref:Hydrolase n=1 Tax=Lentiprolixibacter aurantiacus TaxID=2993939 RepID=A0AAE3MM99_9FLAO|nr:hydrolase [Lentiprolixibacter aurantiacus]MCX2719484.1 hydrolase [Lentiprolixibacter aurantiacus]